MGYDSRGLHVYNGREGMAAGPGNRNDICHSKETEIELEMGHGYNLSRPSPPVLYQLDSVRQRCHQRPKQCHMVGGERKTPMTRID